MRKNSLSWVTTQSSTTGVAIAAALVLAACGGGTTADTAQTISGKVVDGYIEGATVFLDVNKNGQLDSGEVSTTTDTNGAYSLKADANVLAQNPLWVLVPQGAKDADAPNGVVASAYTMAAMPGQTTVTPLTTLLLYHAASQAGGLTPLLAMPSDQMGQVVAEAERSLKVSWDLKDSDSLTQDVVANQSSAPKQRNIAIVAAQLLQSGKTVTDRALPTDSKGANMLAIKYATDYVAAIAKLSEMSAVDGHKSAAAQSSLASAKTALTAKTNADVLNDTKTFDVADIKNTATKVDIVNAYKGGEYYFSSVYAYQGNLSTANYVKNQYFAAGQALNSAYGSWYTNTPAQTDWRMSASGVADPYWAYSDGKWSLFESKNSGLSDKGDGNLQTFTVNGDNSYLTQRSMKAVDVSGKSMALFNVSNSDLSSLLGNATFPTGSVMYVFGPSTYSKERLIANDDSSSTGFDSQIIWKDPAGTVNRARASSLAEVLAAYPDTGSRGLGFSPGAYASRTGCIYFGAGTTSGALYFRGRDTNGSCTGKDAVVATDSPVKPHDGTWSLVTRAGQQVILLNWTDQPATVSCSTSTSPRCIYENVLVVVDGKVRYGSYYPAGVVRAYGSTSWNKTAFEAMLTQLQLPATSAAAMRDMTGRWVSSWSIYDNAVDLFVQMNITSQQTNGYLTGNYTASDRNRGVSYYGTLTGWVSGNAVSFRLDGPLGNYSNPLCRSISGLYGVISGMTGSGSFSYMENCGNGSSIYSGTASFNKD